MSKILVTRSSMPSLDEYVDEIKDIWDSHWLTNMGVKHQKLQKELEKFFDIPHVALYTNGHIALENSRMLHHVIESYIVHHTEKIRTTSQSGTGSDFFFISKILHTEFMPPVLPCPLPLARNDSYAFPLYKLTKRFLSETAPFRYKSRK